MAVMLHLYERAHYRHDTRWLLPDIDTQEAPLCFACVIEMLEDGQVTVIRKKHLLSCFQKCLEKNASAVTGLFFNDTRICAHFIEQLIGMLVNTEDTTASDLIIDILVKLIVNLKQEQFIHCILNGCYKQLLEVSSMRLMLPVFILLGKVFDSMPNLVETVVTDHYILIDQLPHGLMYPNEALKAAVCYLYGKLYSSPSAAKKLADHFTDKLCGLFFGTLENAKTMELQMNCLGLLKQLLNYNQFVSVIMNTSVRLEDSESTPVLQAQQPLPLLLKKVLLCKEEILQVASAQCIAAVLICSPTSYTPAFICADIPEFLFESLLSRNEVLIWSIYCCLLLMVEDKLFFSKGHTAYGIDVILRSLKYILQLNNMELQKQGLLLLTEIFDRQPAEIQLFTNSGIFNAAVDVLLEAVNSPVLDIAIAATKAASVFLRKDHLSIPVQYSGLEKLLSKMLEHCADHPPTLQKRKPLEHPVNRSELKRVPKYGKLLTNTLESFHNACRLALVCQDDCTAEANAFTAPSSEDKNTLVTFSWFLFHVCDRVCIPTVLRHYERRPAPAVMEIFFALLTDMFALAPVKKETFSVKLASTSFICLSMDVKSRLCSGQRNDNLNNACSMFLTCLCATLWELKEAPIVDSLNEVSNILKKGVPLIKGNMVECLSVLQDSSASSTIKDSRCYQQSLIFVMFIAYRMEDRFIAEVNLFWPVLSYLHSVQNQGDQISCTIVRSCLYLLAHCQEKCESLNTASVNTICRLIDNISEIRLVYFHHRQFLKFFFQYSQLQKQYGFQILKLWLHHEDFNMFNEKDPKLSNHCSLKPVFEILKGCPDAIHVLLEIIYRGPEDLAKKGLLIVKAFLQKTVNYDTSNLLLNHLLKILQEAVILPDAEGEQNMPLILNVLCLVQQKGQLDVEMDGTFFKLLYHVSNLSGKCSPTSGNILQPAFNFLYCSLQQSNTSCKIRATAILLSNNSLIDLINNIIEHTWNEAQHDISKMCESLCCSVGLIMSSLICFQHLYTLQVNRTLHVDLHKLVDLVSFKFRKTSSMLMYSVLILFKTLLKHKFSSELLDIVPAKDQTLTEEDGSIKPLTTQSTLYLVAAFQNLFIQKDILLVRAAIDCFDCLIGFLYEKKHDLAVHVATHPWNRNVLFLSLSSKQNLYLQPGLIRLMALFVKYESTSFLTPDEIKEITDETANLKLHELPNHMLMDLQIFLQQLLNTKTAIVSSNRLIIKNILQKTKDIQKEKIFRNILYVGEIAVSMLHATE